MYYRNLVLILFSTFSFIPCSFAQHHNFFISKHAHLLPQSKNTAAKGTANNSRLVTRVGSQNSGGQYILNDSAIYFYSGTHGGDLDHVMKFDTAIDFSYTAPSYAPAAALKQTFDANDNIATQTLTTWDGSGWVNSDRASNTYDANHNVLKNTYEIWNAGTQTWDKDSRDSFAYDANNNQLVYAEQNWDNGSGTWQSSVQYVYTYDAGNRLIQELDISWNGAGWDSLGTFNHTYDANNNKVSTIVIYWDITNQQWKTDYRDSFTYDASNNMITHTDHGWMPATSTWSSARHIITYSNFVGHLPQNIVVQAWNNGTQAYDNDTRTFNTYNTYNQLTSLREETWNNGNWVIGGINNYDRYYYETYSVNVKPLTNTNGTALIYPVPATNDVHITVNWDNEQAATLQIIDMQGKTVFTQQLSNAKQVSTTLSVNGIAPGTYFIKISGSNSSITQQLTITH